MEKQNTKALSKRPKPKGLVAIRTEMLEAMKTETIAAAVATVHSALRAPQLTVDADGRYAIPEGWTATDVQIASDALKPKKDAPFYLDLAQRTVEVQARLDAAKAAPTASLNVGQVNIVAPPQYDVIDVTPAEKK